MAEFADYVLFEASGSKKIDVTPDMMEYDFVNGCEDPATLQAILTTLKEGEYGYYPHVCLFMFLYILLRWRIWPLLSFLA